MLVCGVVLALYVYVVLTADDVGMWGGFSSVCVCSANSWWCWCVVVSVLHGGEWGGAVDEWEDPTADQSWPGKGWGLCVGEWHWVQHNCTSPQSTSPRCCWVMLCAAWLYITTEYITTLLLSDAVCSMIVHHHRVHHHTVVKWCSVQNDCTSPHSVGEWHRVQHGCISPQSTSPHCVGERCCVQHDCTSPQSTPSLPLCCMATACFVLCVVIISSFVCVVDGS